jgi:hypothetical protein
MNLEDRVKSALEALHRFLSDGGRILHPHESIHRQMICEGCDNSKIVGGFCESITGSENLPGCGCYLPVKTLMSTEKCPQEKWLAITSLERAADVVPNQFNQVNTPCGACPQKVAENG